MFPSTSNDMPPRELPDLELPPDWDSRDFWPSRYWPRPFKGALEREFWQNYNRKVLPMRRMASLIGIVCWCVLIPWDLWLASDIPAYRAVLPWMIGLRMVGTCAFVALHIHYFRIKPDRDDPHDAELPLVLQSILSFILCSCLGLTAPPPVGEVYIALGYFTTVSTQVSVWGCSARSVIWISGSSIVVALLTAVAASCMERPLLLATHPAQYFVTFFILLVALLSAGCFTAAIAEVVSRVAFMRHRTFEIQRKREQYQAQELRILNEALAASNAQAQARLLSVVQLQEQLRKEADSRTRAQAQFLANAVHDLRQPVQAISSALYPVTQAIEQGQRDRAAELLGLSHRAISYLQGQLAAILDISRLESGAVKPRLEPVDVLSLVRDALNALQDQAHQLGVRLHLDQAHALDSTPAFAALTDPTLLQRILGNLVSNGMKYRRTDQPGGAMVSVALTDSKGDNGVPMVRVTVRDNGIGMAAEMVESGRIFQPFFQIDNQLVEIEKGVGLGLAIVRALVDLLPQHRLSVTSVVGQGTSFDVLVPQAPPSTLREVNGERLPVRLKESAGLILLVEDDDFVRVATQRLLETLGQECLSFPSFEAFERTVNDLLLPPALIMSDYRLGGGKTASDVWRAATNRFPEVPVIVLTGDEIDVLRVPELRGLDVLTKPVQVRTLIDVLARHLGTHHDED